MESKSVLTVDLTEVDVHPMNKIHRCEVRMYVLVKVRDCNGHVQYSCTQNKFLSDGPKTKISVFEIFEIISRFISPEDWLKI